MCKVLGGSSPTPHRNLVIHHFSPNLSLVTLIKWQAYRGRLISFKNAVSSGKEGDVY